MLNRSRSVGLIAIAALFGLLAFAGGMAAQEGINRITADKLVIHNAQGHEVVVLEAGKKGGRLILRDLDEGRVLVIEPSTAELNPEWIAIEPKPTITPEPPPAPAGPDLSGIEVRAGGSPTAEETTLAKRIIAAGWEYIMPRPKSNQARWGNKDGRTTWYNGYWVNEDTGRYSSTAPKASDLFAGDGQDVRGWRRGGSPRYPDVIEWLCSKSGGVEPR